MIDPIREFSVIRKDLWDAAGWHGVAFLSQPSSGFPPGIGLLFNDIAAGRKIFSDWRRRYGPGDGNGVIRLSVISGTHPSKGVGMTVHFSTDPDGIVRQDTDEARLSMEPFTKFDSRWLFRSVSVPYSPLAAFRSELLRYGGKYFLTPLCATSPNAKSRAVEPDWDHLFKMQRILFRDFSDIRPEDIDAMII